MFFFLLLFEGPLHHFSKKKSQKEADIEKESIGSEIRTSFRLRVSAFIISGYRDQNYSNMCVEYRTGS
jgi:hypothetical protein